MEVEGGVKALDFVFRWYLIRIPTVLLDIVTEIGYTVVFSSRSMKTPG
jgi:hypothetical protein